MYTFGLTLLTQVSVEITPGASGVLLMKAFFHSVIPLLFISRIINFDKIRMIALTRRADLGPRVVCWPEGLDSLWDLDSSL